jgi:hypothetical protein
MQNQSQSKTQSQNLNLNKMYAKKISNNSAASVVKPFCKVCFDANKPESQYTSHFVRKTKDLNSEILCPIILATECRYCHKLGHTISNCSLRAKNNARHAHAMQAPVPVQRPMQASVQVPVRGNNRYAAFEVEDEVEVEVEVQVQVNETEFPLLGGKSAAVQDTSSVSYAKAFASKPAQAQVQVQAQVPAPSTKCVAVCIEDGKKQKSICEEEEEQLTVEEQYGERMYAVLYQYYHSYTGKIVGMLLECEREELDEFMMNARALYERADEAYTVLKQGESSVQTPLYRKLAEDNDW